MSRRLGPVLICASAALAFGAGCGSDLEAPGAPGAGNAAGTGATANGGAGGVSAGSGGTPSTGGVSGSSATGGSAGDPDCAAAGPGPEPGPTCVAGGEADTAASVLRRLSRVEYQLTLQDLFALQAPPNIDAVPPDVYYHGFSTVAEQQSISAAHLRSYLDVSRALADALLADSARVSSVVGCNLTAADCLSTFVTRFGRLAYRRPLDQVEVDGIVSAATADALDVNDRFRYAIESLLTSANFLYRVEVGSSPEGLSTLGPYEVASRLSFALWGRAPSAELLDRAAAGELDSAAGLDAVAASMLVDPLAERFFAAFFRQWLGYEALRAPNQPPADWSDELMPAMQAETDQVLSVHAWGGLSLIDALTSNTTRLSPELATFYGLPAPSADGSVTIPAGHPRANTGLLTHASLLSAKGDGDPIAIRGNWLRRTFLCEEVQAIDLGEIGEQLVGLTRVEIVQKRNIESACVGCHSLIDPIGVGFAQFDATGRYDATVDPTVFGVDTALPDAACPAFSTVAELAQKLASMPQVATCIADKAFLYVNGREPGAADACAVDATSRSFRDGGHDFRALIRGLIQAPAFRLRRAPAP